MIIWSPGARADIERLRSFIQPKNPDAARRAIKTIRDGVKAIQEIPNIGRPILTFPENVRERLIGFGASVYVVRYRVQADIILIIEIRHGREAGDR